MLNELAKQVHENAKSHGFFENEKNIGEMLCLIHSEVSEALEADRIGKYANGCLINPEFSDSSSNENFTAYFVGNVKNSFEDELADVIIRVLDLCAFKGIDIESHIKAKMRYNSLRGHKHGKAY